MIGILKNIASFFSNVWLSLLSLIKVMLLSGRVSIKKENRSKDLVILGNGPSLKAMLPDCLSKKDDYDFLCVNNFPNTEYYTSIQPAHFVITSSEFWNNEETIDQNKQIRYDIIDAYLDKTTWASTFHLPVEAKRKQSFIKRFKDHPCIKLSFYNKTPIEGLRSLSHVFIRTNKGMPRPHNVLIPSIILGINMGYDTINLLGADHSWLTELSVDSNNNALLSQKHFYKSAQDEKGHMYQNGKTPRTLDQILHKFMLTFKAYHVIADYAKGENSKILNCTPGSFIDAFDRKSLFI